MKLFLPKQFLGAVRDLVTQALRDSKVQVKSLSKSKIHAKAPIVRPL